MGLKPWNTQADEPRELGDARDFHGPRPETAALEMSLDPIDYGIDGLEIGAKGNPLCIPAPSPDP